MKNPFSVVKDFEDAVAEYTGAPFCVAVSSCTSALFTCLVWEQGFAHYYESGIPIEYISIPKRTYIGVAQSILNAGFKVRFRDEEWSGSYDLNPLKIADSARRFTSNMYVPHYLICTSHHWSKTLPIGHGGCILHDNKQFDEWARKFRFDGRTDGLSAEQETNPIRGYHLYLLPELAASGLVRLNSLPKQNADLPNSNYPDLSQMDIFK